MTDGDPRDALGFSWFSWIVVGLEAELEETDDFISTLSGVVGDRVSGYALGFGLSF